MTYRLRRDRVGLLKWERSPCHDRKRSRCHIFPSGAKLCPRDSFLNRSNCRVSTMPPLEGQSVPTQGQGSGELSETGAILRRILEGMEANVGEQFFPSLVQQLAASLGVDYAYISELSDDGSRFRSKAAWGKGSPLPPFDVPVKGPCETMLTRKCVHHSAHLRALYPQVQLIQEIEVESYCGVPVVGMQDRVLGHLAIMDSKPMPDPARATAILGIFEIGRAHV